MRRPLLRALSCLLPFVPLLTACSGPPVPVVVRPAVPPGLLACASQPPVPNLAGPRWDLSLALFIVDLSAAGADCRAKLAAVAGLVR